MEPSSVLARLIDAGASYADVRIEASETTSLEWQDGSLREAVQGMETEFGLRVLYGGTWGIASGVRESEIPGAGDRALALAKAACLRLDSKTAKARLAEVPAGRGRFALPVRQPLGEVSLEARADLVRSVGTECRQGEVQSVHVSYDDGTTETRFLSSEGADLVEVSSRAFLHATLTASRGGRRAGNSMRVAGTGGWEIFRNTDAVEKAREARATTERLLSAKAAPSGSFVVVCDPALAGVFAHEAIGHACEADLVLAGSSILRGRIGSKIGSDAVTIEDDPTRPNGFGSFLWDDEGVRARPRTLVRRGVLVGYLHSRETAGRLGMEPNGAARAEGAGVEPLVRMSNTVVRGGRGTMEELVAGVRRGIFAKGTRGGQVDEARGTFTFNAQEAFAIRNGTIGESYRDVSLSGDILETLRSIDAVSADDELHAGICGKGQWVPVGDGGAGIRIRSCRVGGSS
jgi:TldD protein